MSTISSEYFGRNSGRYSANQSGKYKGFGVVDFEKGTVGDNYEPYPMSSGQMTGGSAARLATGGSAARLPTGGSATAVSPFVKPAGKVYKFMKPKVTMPAMMHRHDIAHSAPAVPAPKKVSTHKRKSGKSKGSKRHTKKSAGRR